MNRYRTMRRLRGPILLLLVGVLALLNQANILSWGKSWPLFLIVAGLLVLAERAVLTSAVRGFQQPFPGQPGAAANPIPYPADAVDLHRLAGAEQLLPAETTADSPNAGKDSEGGQA
jgi:hypothetical protein